MLLAKRLSPKPRAQRRKGGTWVSSRSPLGTAPFPFALALHLVMGAGARSPRLVEQQGGARVRR
jgi:hypothetical protein